MTLDRKTAKERREIEERQRQEVDGDETYVMTRSADHSVWVRSGQFIERYKVLWYFIMAIFLALGFDFKTPRQFYAALEKRVDDQARELVEAEIDRKKMDAKLNILIRFRCLDQTTREMNIAGVDCSDYLYPNPVKVP